MGAIQVAAVGYDIPADTLDLYKSNSPLNAIKALLRDVESNTHNPASVVRYDDDDGRSHMLLCCYADLRRRPLSYKELEEVPIPSEFLRLPERLHTSGDIRRVVLNGMVFSYDDNGKTRVDNEAVIGYYNSFSLPDLSSNFYSAALHHLQPIRAYRSEECGHF